MRLPSRRANDDVDAARGEPRQIRRAPPRPARNQSPRPPAATTRGCRGIVDVDGAGDAEPVVGRQRFDQAPHPAAADDQERGASRRQAVRDRRQPRPRARRTCRAGEPSPPPPPRPAARRSRSGATPPATPSAAGNCSSDPRMRDASRGSRRRPSPTAQRIAMSCSTRTSANADSSSTSSSSRLSSSMVTEMLTSDVLTTSIGVRQRSNTSKTRRRKPCAISMRVEVMSTTVTWRLQASAASGSSTGELGRDQRAAAVEPAAVQDADRDVLGRRRAGSCSGAAPWRRSTPARRLPRTTAAARRASRPRRADRRSSCRRRRSRSESRWRRARRRGSRPSNRTRRGRASSSRRSWWRRRSRRRPARGRRRRAARGARPTAAVVSSISGSAQPKVSLVISTRRGSTQTAGRPAAWQAASTIRLLSSSPKAATASRVRGDGVLQRRRWRAAGCAARPRQPRCALAGPSGIGRPPGARPASCRCCSSSSPAATAASSAAAAAAAQVKQPVGDSRQRRHHDHGAARAVRRADVAHEPADRFRIADRRSAEFQDHRTRTHHSSICRLTLDDCGLRFSLTNKNAGPVSTGRRRVLLAFLYMSDHAHVHTAGPPGRLTRFREATACACPGNHLRESIQTGTEARQLPDVRGWRFAVRAGLAPGSSRQTCLAVARSAKAGQRMICSGRRRQVAEQPQDDAAAVADDVELARLVDAEGADVAELRRRRAPRCAR